MYFENQNNFPYLSRLGLFDNKADLSSICPK